MGVLDVLMVLYAFDIVVGFVAASGELFSAFCGLRCIVDGVGSDVPLRLLDRCGRCGLLTLTVRLFFWKGVAFVPAVGDLF
ncbi:hypothetical protein SK79_01218 [Escherichia coli]|nr:hypothetical protein SK79_01218 [Escherichia coli]